VDGTEINDLVSTLLNSDYGPTFLGSTGAIFFIIILSLAIGHVIGFVYILTHEGISYSRTFVASITAVPVLVATMMVVMAGNLLVAFGLAAVGMVHFRNMMKDTRDTVFVLWTFSEGMTVGMMRFSTAWLAALGIGAMFLYLRFTGFGSRNRYDAVLTLRVTGDLATSGPHLRQILNSYTTRPHLTNERCAPDGGMDMTYRLRLRDPSRVEELQTLLSRTEGLANVAVFKHGEESEI
jgi:hypothetical protein